jgi:hypothetical protein
MTPIELAEMFEVTEGQVWSALTVLNLFDEAKKPIPAAISGRFISEDGKILRRGVSMLTNVL